MHGRRSVPDPTRQEEPKTAKVGDDSISSSFGHGKGQSEKRRPPLEGVWNYSELHTNVQTCVSFFPGHTHTHIHTQTRVHTHIRTHYK